ncbi:hypothetical protein P7K49_002013 [Saguinus oedipus]|uniref:Uncharacterized protein n=1 Tax=Saguinus oedipus TaxID=9490 RepID=A0ABQ9WG37_SAGOE|nr:hypothetical protein P7K49_002013 [Saguinus oedipus]
MAPAGVLQPRGPTRRRPGAHQGWAEPGARRRASAERWGPERSCGPRKPMGTQPRRAILEGRRLGWGSGRSQLQAEVGLKQGGSGTGTVLWNLALRRGRVRRPRPPYFRPGPVPTVEPQAEPA